MRPLDEIKLEKGPKVTVELFDERASHLLRQYQTVVYSDLPSPWQQILLAHLPGSFSEQTVGPSSSLPASSMDKGIL